MTTCEHAPTAVSLFDGIGGFPLALGRAGFRTVATVEIDPAAAGVTAGRFPRAEHFADVTEVTADDILAAGFCPACGVLTGGWPCQDLSLAGRRLGLGGARSGLFWEIVRLAQGLRPRWLLLENVPGLLSAVCSCPGLGTCRAGCVDPHPVRGGLCGSRRGRGGHCMEIHGGAMGAVLGALGELGYGFAYRVLDAQHFGVPQRRRRVVIVGHLGDPARTGEVLLEPEGSGGHPAPGGTARSRTPSCPGSGTQGVVNALTSNMAGGGGGPDDNTAQGGHLVATTVLARGGKGPDSDATTTMIVHTPSSEASAPSEDGTGRGTPLVTVPTLTASMGSNNAAPGNGGKDEMVVPVDLAQVTSKQNRSNPRPGDPSRRAAPTLRSGRTSAAGQAVSETSGVRRLTPTECERLQGFPDGWTETAARVERNGNRWKVTGNVVQSDSARYRELGNSVAVPVFEWVARRMAAADGRSA